MAKTVNIEYVQRITGMNEEDASNLMFLLHSSQEVLKDWYSKMDTEDHKYASQLLYLFKEAIDNQEIELILQKKQEFNEANLVLKKIMYS